MTAAVRNLTHRLNRFYRALATGSVFVLFGLGAIFVSATIFPYLRITSRDTGTARRRIQRAMMRTFHVYMEIMRRVKVMTYEARGVERLREPGRLIVANHPTLIDVVFMVSLIPEVDCIVKRGLWRNPFLRWPVLWASYIPNSEGDELIEACAARLRQGHSLLVFPEGTRTVPGQPMRMQRGAAHIALAADVEILPVKISCDPPTLFKGNPWHRVPERAFHLKVEVGQPVPAAQFRQGGEAPTRAARHLTQWLLAYYGNSVADHTLTATEQVKSSAINASGTAPAEC
jgi:1-acyl-sn-glycerol-3-phosphate acyltransferase